MMKLSLFVGVVFVLGMAQQSSCYPEQERHNEEQMAVCKRAGGLPIMVWDQAKMMSIYRGCQIPCSPPLVAPDLEGR